MYIYICIYIYYEGGVIWCRINHHPPLKHRPCALASLAPPPVPSGYELCSSPSKVFLRYVFLAIIIIDCTTLVERGPLLTPSTMFEKSMVLGMCAWGGIQE